MGEAKVSRILVPTDFSETANHALRYAGELAARMGASLTVLYADPFAPPVEYMAAVGYWDDSTFQTLKQDAREQLEREVAANISSAVPRDLVVCVATAVDGILEQAGESGAGLIVMGTHGRTGFRRLVIGSITEAIMRRAEVPVIAVPPGAATPASIRTVVCPVFCDDQCLQALSFAAQLVPSDARFIVVRATPEDDVSQSADDLFELRAWMPEEIALRTEMRLFSNEHMAKQINGLAATEHADLIVAAESGERRLGHLTAGTFAERLVQHSECPVLSMGTQAVAVAERVALQEKRTDAVRANL